MLLLKDVYKEYKNKKITVKALDGLTLNVDEGDFLTVMGESGCGKTTFLNAVGGLVKIDSGIIKFNDTDISKLNADKLLEYRLKNIGIINQNICLLNDRTVFQNVELPLKIRGVEKEERKEMVKSSLEKLGILHKISVFPNELSGGEKQRVAIARALVYNPKILLADEPTASLDEDNTKIVLEQLVKISKLGTTVILVTHNKELSKVGNRCIIIERGRIKID